MSFRELDIKKEYRSFSDNIVKDFYIPVLQKSVLYKRAVGFFSSTALIELSYGITGLVSNGGRIQLIASPKLQEEDIEAIAKGYEERNRVIGRVLVNSFSEPRNYFEEQRLNLLATLIAEGKLDIKIAFTESDIGIGLYHEKMGLFYDKEDNIIAFTGSMNESLTAFSFNYETIDVFCSWQEEEERVYTKETAFNSLWNDYEPCIKIMDFPQIAKEKLLSYKSEELDMQIDKSEFFPETEEVLTVKEYGPVVPKDIKLYDYQIEAIQEWAKRSYVGIFDMATGTGKTYTGLAAAAALFEHCNGTLAVIIVCPFQHLVEQWVEDILKFNMKPIVGYSASKQKDWKRRLKDAVIDYNLGIKKHFCFVTTNATFASKYVQDRMNSLKGNVLLVIDEAHNFGAENLRSKLKPNIPYRLALSATLDRYGDEEGTRALYEYFGDKCIEYTLERAIRENKLTPYYYYPTIVCLNDDELDEYRAITRKLSKYFFPKYKEKVEIDEVAKLMLIKRARIVAAAQEKITKLYEIMKEYKDKKHILVYCGATTINDPNYQEGVADEFETRQIDAVTKMLGNKLKMRVSQFTSAESSKDREILKREFATGNHIQALVAIRCLDEGVNIPNIKYAFILASSTNPKEYIQRRGRVLRKAPGKKHAFIYDFITLPRPLDSIQNTPSEEINLDRSLIKRELTRMREFASIAENPADTYKIIDLIEEKYNFYFYWR